MLQTASAHAVSTAAPRRAVLASILVVVSLASAAVVAGDHRLFFTDFMTPVGDEASNDILITDAKRFALFHGNYSRIGFYHPGPFYLQWIALVELAFVDAVPVFASPFAAQLFALILLHAGAAGVSVLAWTRALGNLPMAAVAAAVMFAVPLAFIDLNYLLVPWPPYMYIPSAALVASAVVGLAAGDARWLPVLVFGLAQLVHGHASFIGIVPMMLATGAAAAVMMGHVPRSALHPTAIVDGVRAHRRIAAISVGVLVLFAAPMAIQTVIAWPGEFPKYFAFAGSPRSHGPLAAAGYVLGFLPLKGVWVLALLVPPAWVRHGLPVAIRCRATAVLLLALVLPSAWFYGWRGVDTLQERYLLLWVLPFAGAALAATLVYVASLLPGPVLRPALLAGAAAAAVYASAPFVTSGLDGRRAEILRGTEMTQRTLDGAARGARPGGTMALQLDVGGDAWVRTWPEVVGLLAAMNRQGEHFFCIEQSSWHLLFHERYRCRADQVDRLLVVTTRDRAPDGWFWELPQAVFRPASAPSPDATVHGARMGEAGVFLFGDWSTPEHWGIWSNGPRATLMFDSARLPHRFRMTLVARTFPPSDAGGQTVRVEDAAGRVLATLVNADTPQSFALTVQRPADERVSLSFVIERPTTPRSVGHGSDDRRLGFGLETLSIEAD